MIIEFDNAFIETLKQNYNANGKTQILDNRRYYLLGIEIESSPFFLCIPLHANGMDFLPILKPSTSSHWKNHGLNFEKMLLVKKTDLINYSQISSVDNYVWRDINSKKEIIVDRVEKYMKDFLEMKQKQSKGQCLSKTDKNILKFSSLNHVPSYIEELQLFNQVTLKFNYADLTKEFLEKE